MIWRSDNDYETLDEALQALEVALVEGMKQYE